MRAPLRLSAATVLLLSLEACGYRVAGRADLLPKTVQTVAIPAFANNTSRYRLSHRIPRLLAREFIARTRLQVVADVNMADAVLYGSIVNISAFPSTFDTATGRAAGVDISVVLQINLVERATGRTLYANPSMNVRERYEISVDPLAYFEESDTALDRLGAQLARAIVSAILEGF